MEQSSNSLITFTVKRNEPELIVPAMPTPHELKQLSDIDDQPSLRANYESVIFFKNTGRKEGKDPAKIIREALGKALVHYYPLAGRLVEGPNNKLLVDCSGQGVLFIEASANVTLDQLGDTIVSPYPYLDEVAYNVPGSDGVFGCPLLRVQVTRLLCGGFIWALRGSHTLCDGVGFAQFFIATVEIIVGCNIPSTVPVWQRELMNSREPPRVTFEHHEYEDKAVNFVPDQADDVSQRSFLISPYFVKGIRKDLPEFLTKCTSYEILTACLWKCVVLASNLDHEELVYVSVVVNARDDKYNANIPEGYYGNAIAFPSAVSKSKDVCEKPLGYVVELVRAAKERMSSEYIHSVADLMATKGRPSARAKGLLLVSDMRFVVEPFDFGLGFPVFNLPVVRVPGVFHLTLYKHKEGRESIVVATCLAQSIMTRFEKEFDKMTAITPSIP